MDAYENKWIFFYGLALAMYLLLRNYSILLLQLLPVQINMRSHTLGLVKMYSLGASINLVVPSIS
jgi:hypothetical protein